MLHFWQCSGFLGSVSFWAPRFRISLRIRIPLRILLLSGKNSKKNLYFHCFVASLWLIYKYFILISVSNPEVPVQQHYTYRRRLFEWAPLAVPARKYVRRTIKNRPIALRTMMTTGSVLGKRAPDFSPLPARISMRRGLIGCAAGTPWEPSVTHSWPATTWPVIETLVDILLRCTAHDKALNWETRPFYWVYLFSRE